ncbi:hypothetical protein CR513_37611, partial [Mucuna pruriens]
MRSLKYFVRELKMKKVFEFLQLEVIMEKNLKMSSSNHFVKILVFSITFLHRELLNKMRRNRTLQEMAKTMFCENSLQKHFWEEVVNIVYYVQNKILNRSMLDKTLYEL